MCEQRLVSIFLSSKVRTSREVDRFVWRCPRSPISMHDAFRIQRRSGNIEAVYRLADKTGRIVPSSIATRELLVELPNTVQSMCFARQQRYKP